MDDERTIKVNFSFYPEDEKALDDRVRALKAAGLKVREGTVIRALFHMTSSADMLARSLELTTRLAREGAPEWGSSSASATVDLPATEVKKIDDVIDLLAKVSVTATRSFVLRALILSSPPGKKMVPLLEAFLEKFPYKPRGLSAIRLAAKARRDG